MADNKVIYLDNAATTIPNKDVVALYNDIEINHFGNSSSIHKLGVESLNYLNKARELILKTFNLKNYKVYFTSCSTEANNLAIKGYVKKYSSRGKHLITSNVEHASVLECFKALEKEGFDVTYLKVNSKGVIDPKDLEAAMRNDTILVSIMGTNNEIGSINNIKELSKIVHKNPKVVFHCDTTQDIGKTSLDFNDIDMFVVSSHKINGLKGSGALICKNSISFDPVLNGGGQEEGFRSGTVSVALACSLAKAIKLAYPIVDLKEKHDYLFNLLNNMEGIELNSFFEGSPYIINFSLLDKKAAVVVEALSNKGIYVSSVSACNSKGEAMSNVVSALGKDDKKAHNTIRISLSKDTTIEELDIFVKELKYVLETIK